MTNEFDTALAVLLILYAAVIVRQILVRGPPLSVLFLIAGGAMVALGVLTPSAALASLNFSVLIFLFSMFVFAVALEKAGVLTHIASWLLSVSRRAENVPFYLFLGFGLLSAFLVNDAIVLLSVPLLLGLSRKMRVSPVPLLLTVAYAVTVGSVMTPLGNPQNALISLSSGIPTPFTTFAVYLAIPTFLNLLIGGWLLQRWFGPDLQKAAGDAPLSVSDSVISFFPKSPEGGWVSWLRARPSVMIFPGMIAFFLANDIGSEFFHMVALPIWAIALGGALLLLLLHPTSRSLIEGVDWNTLLLFAGLFVVMGAVSAAGIFTHLDQFLAIPASTGPRSSPQTLGILMLSSLGGSQILSNVPWAALSVPFLHNLGYGASNPRIWVTLAAGTTLAGNLTLLGAASNLIVVNQAERVGVKISFFQFSRYGVPLTLITFAVTFTALLVGI